MTEILLPKSFRNVRVRDGVRSNLFSLEDIGLWIQEYQEDNFNIWYMWTSFPDQEDSTIRARFVCQFSPLLDSGESAGFKCPAEIRVEITDEGDEYSKDGLPAVIRFLDEHYHPLEAMNMIRSIFEKLFEHSMGRNESRLFYIKIMEHRLGRPIDNWAKPNKFLVKQWYEHWINNRIFETRAEKKDTHLETDEVQTQTDAKTHFENEVNQMESDETQMKNDLSQVEEVEIQVAFEETPKLQMEPGTSNKKESTTAKVTFSNFCGC